MKNPLNPLLLIALSVSLSAGVALFLADPTSAPGTRAAAPAGIALTEIEARLSRIELALGQLQRSPLETTRAAPAERAQPTRTPKDYTALLERLEDLEGQLMRVREQGQPAPLNAEEVALAESERKRKREVAVAEAKLTVGDPAASVEDKLEAHASLRRVADAYTAEMLADLVQIGLADSDPENRADVWRNFDGSSHLPELVPHLREALANDRDPRARDEAAETLGNYLDDPDVLAALKWSAENDESPRVRQKALRTLNAWSLLLAERER